MRVLTSTFYARLSSNTAVSAVLGLARCAVQPRCPPHSRKFSAANWIQTEPVVSTEQDTFVRRYITWFKELPVWKKVVYTTGTAGLLGVVGDNVNKYITRKKLEKAAAAEREAKLHIKRIVALQDYMSGKSFAEDNPFEGMTPLEIQYFVAKHSKTDLFEGMTVEEIDEYVQANG